MTNLATLQQRYNQLATHTLPTLKAEHQTLQQRQAEYHTQLKELGWDGTQPLDQWLAAISQQRDTKLAEAAAALKEAEDAVAAIEQQATAHTA